MSAEPQATTRTNVIYIASKSANGSKGSLSSCSDIGSTSSSISSISSVGSVPATGNANPQNTRRPTRIPPSNTLRHLSAPPPNKISAISSPSIMDRIADAGEVPLPSPSSPSTTYTRKRRHSADEIMDMPSLPPARRGIVGASGSATPEEPAPSPPLRALDFEFADDSFRRDPTGRVHIEVVPTPNASSNEDIMELQAHDEEDPPSRGSASASPMISPHFQLGEPTEPRSDHSAHPLYPLENEFRCSICCELMVAAHSLLCGHTFCGICLAMWIAGAKKNCPECRALVIRSPRSMFPIYKLDGGIEILAKLMLNEQELEERRSRKEEWLQYNQERQPVYPRSVFNPAAAAAIAASSNSNFTSLTNPVGLRRYSALLREQYAQVLRGIQDTSVASPTNETSSFTSSPVAPMIHGPAVRSRPIPIPRGIPRST